MRPLAFILIVTCILFSGMSQAQSGGAWIDAIPEPQQAIEKISGKDELETKSLQGATIYAIAQVILRLSGNEFASPRRLTAREQALHTRYTEFYVSFSKEYTDKLNHGLSPERIAELGNQRPSAAFANLESRYRSNPGFQRHAFTEVMGEDWVKEWYEPMVERDMRTVADVRAWSDAQMKASKARSQELIEQDAANAVVRLIGVLIFLAGAVWMARGSRSVRLDPDDPMRLTGRRRGWTLSPYTGFASDIRVYTSQRTVTTVQRHNKLGPDDVSRHTTTTHHCEFILNNKNSKHPVHLTDGGLQVGEGHLVSCVWPGNGRKSAGMLLAYNHDTNQRAVFSQTIGWLVRPRFLPGPVMMLGVAIAVHWSMAFTFLLLFSLAVWMLGVIRTRAFCQRDLPRIFERLRASESEFSPLVGVGG